METKEERQEWNERKIHKNNPSDATDARFSLTIFPSVPGTSYPRNAGRNRVHAKPRYFRQKTTLLAARFAIGPGKSQPRLEKHRPTGVVVYREISTLTSFRRAAPCNSFRRSASPYGDEELSIRPPRIAAKITLSIGRCHFFHTPVLPDLLSRSRAHRSGMMIALSSPTSDEFGLAPVKRYSRAAHATSSALSSTRVLTDFVYCSTMAVASGLAKELRAWRGVGVCFTRPRVRPLF